MKIQSLSPIQAKLLKKMLYLAMLKNSLKNSWMQRRLTS